MKHEVTISGMTCQSCVARVRAALEAVPEVASVNVTLDPPAAQLDIRQTIRAGDLRAALQAAGEYDIAQPARSKPRALTYLPLLLVLALVVAGTALLTARTGNTDETAIMSDFMGLFLVMFAFFKLLDVRGFARAFRTYDLIADQSYGWALAYPFVELALGVGYLVRWQPMVVNFVTLVLMLIGTFGVIGALRSKKQIRCACLGSVFSLPMSVVTLAEDLLMALMALAMLARSVV